MPVAKAPADVPGKGKGKFKGKFHYLPAFQREVNQPDTAETYEEFQEQRNIAWAKAESHNAWVASKTSPAVKAAQDAADAEHRAKQAALAKAKESPKVPPRPPSPPDRKRRIDRRSI